MYGLLPKSTLVATALLLLAGCTSTPPADFSWNGVWRGSSGSRTTEIAISGNNVQYWRSNGEKQPLASSSVGANSVTIKHVQGATVTLHPRSDGKVTYSWRGRGQSSSAVLTKG